MRNDCPQRRRQGRSTGSLLLAIALFTRPVAAQQGTHFEVLTIPPRNAGTCLPPLLKGDSSARVQQGNRLVIRSLDPGSSREISTFVDQAGRHMGYSDRSYAMTATVRGTSASITAFLGPRDTIIGFRMDIATTVPDSVMTARDYAEIRAIMDKATSTHSNRSLDSAEQRRVRAMIDFMRQRCP